MNRRQFLGVTAGLSSVVGAGAWGYDVWRKRGVSPETDAVVTMAEIPPGETVGLQRVATGFEKPMRLTSAPESRDRRFLVDGTGTIHVLTDAGRRGDPFLDVINRISGNTGLGNEGGLLGLAFHPEFQTNRKFYVRYSGDLGPEMPADYSHTFVLAEFEATADGENANPDSERRLLEIPEPQRTHNSGPMAFGPDGLLYLTIGDGGGENDTDPGHADDWYETNAGGNGQDITENRLGSILRIDVDSRADGLEYGIPSSNPRVGKEGFDELYAWGFRNPYGLSFDGDELYVPDSGQDIAEEVNLVEKGGNYGWNVREGTTCFNAVDSQRPRRSCPSESPRGNTLEDPIIEYRHDTEQKSFGTVAVGGHRYRNATVSAIQDAYVFANYGSPDGTPNGRLLAARPPEDGSGQWDLHRLLIEGSDDGHVHQFIIGMGQDAAGELYLLGAHPEQVGSVYRIVSAEEGTFGSSSTTANSTNSS